MHRTICRRSAGVPALNNPFASPLTGILTATLLLATPLAAHDPQPPEDETLRVYDEVEVKARGDNLVGLASSATEGATGYEDLARRPLARPGSLVETAPGVIATQHSGGGKANQYFLRGFNLDHGTDFSVWVAGVPVNMPSHGHGQGYADLNFLIPEMVDSVRYRKGPYYAESGDFSAAGGIDMELLRSLPSRHVVATGGGDSFGRLLWAESFSRAEDEDLLVAVDLFHRDGPWTRDEENEGAKALVRYSKGDTYRGFTLTAMGYDADWLSTDQVPRRAVESGQIDRFDLVDPGPRGATERYSLSAEYYHGHSDSLTRVRGYLLHYDFDLISNFTYFLEDEDNGDQFEQKDRRLVAGLDLRHSWLGQWGDRILESSAGFQLRTDDIENGLFRTSDLVRLGAVRQDDVDQFGGGPWIETQIAWSDTVRTRLGLRADYYRADVSSDLAINSGTEEDWLLSPKLSVILGPWSDTEVYVNAGYGFHSNDARGAVIRVDPVSGDPVDPVQGLVRAKGADIGVRTTSVPGLQSTFTVFALELDSELVFVGDGGATEASRPSRRLGIEWTNFYRIRDWLTLDLDLTWTDAEFTDDDPSGDRIPGAIEETLAAGVSVDPGGKFFGSLRWRYFGAAPLIEDDSVRSTTSSLVDGRLGYRLGDDIELHLDVFNLFDREASDIEYFYASRLPGEPSGGIEDIHFHPVESRTARLSVSWRP